MLGKGHFLSQESWWSTHALSIFQKTLHGRSFFLPTAIHESLANLSCTVNYNPKPKKSHSTACSSKHTSIQQEAEPPRCLPHSLKTKVGRFDGNVMSDLCLFKSSCSLPLPTMQFQLSLPQQWGNSPKTQTSFHQLLH